MGFAEERRADIILLEVQSDAVDVVWKLQQFSCGYSVEAVDSGDAIARGQHGPDLLNLDCFIIVLDLLPDDSANFCGA